MKKNYNHLILLACAITLHMVSLPACAQVIVQDNILSFGPNDKPMRTIPIANTSKTDTLNVTATVFEMDYNNGNALTKTTDIMVVPPHMRLVPGHKALARVIIKKRPEDGNGENSNEKAYRIRFTPSLAKNTPELPTQSAVTSEVKVLVGTGILMWVTPKDAKVKYKTTWNNDGLLVENTGNTNLIFRQEKQCIEGVNCQIEGIRLWPGKTWQLNVPKNLRDKPLKLEMRALDDIKIVEVAPQ